MNTVDTRWTSILLAAACAAPAACSGSTAPTDAEDSRLVAFDNQSDADVQLRLEGIDIRVDASLKPRFAAYSREGSVRTRLNMEGMPEPEGDGPLQLFWLDGRPLALDDSTLCIGDAEFGEVTATDTVRLDAAGVHVNGASRGPLPD
jgi:hypothetical protein